VNGVLYELDGLQSGPIAHGPVSGDAWVQRALEVIRSRIALYGGRELHFSLMAVVADPRSRLRATLLRLASDRAAAAAAMQERGDAVPEVY
jgi:ubiquitin carboxyl-terminal hydrolase L5